jgi:hypothetical protein
MSIHDGSLRPLRITRTVVVKSYNTVPRRGYQNTLLSPVVKRRNVLFIFLAGWFEATLFEFLHLGSVLDVEREYSSLLVADKELSFPFIEANASNIFGSEVSENRLQSSISCVPNLDTLGVSGDESVEHIIVQHCQTGLVIC